MLEVGVVTGYVVAEVVYLIDRAQIKVIRIASRPTFGSRPIAALIDRCIHIGATHKVACHILMRAHHPLPVGAGGVARLA